MSAHAQPSWFDPKAIEKALDSEREFGRVVWGLLCLELWHQIYIDGAMKPNA